MLSTPGFDGERVAIWWRLIMSMTTQEKPQRPKVTLIPAKGVSQTINYLLEDRNELEWLVAIGRKKKGEKFFYATGGGIIEKIGTTCTLQTTFILPPLCDEWG